MFVRRIAAALLCIVVLHLSIGVLHAQIPQDHAYQITLRNYLATLTENDFDVVLAPVTYDDSYFTTMDELHATMILLEDYGRKSTIDITGLRVDASYFVLSAIEQNGEVRMRAGRNSGFIDPINTAWWASWAYAGNPHYESRAVKLRAFVSAAVDMMMTDHALETSVENQRSDYVGGYLAKYGYVYFIVKDILDPDVQQAYEAGLLKFFERLESYHPYGSGGADMEAFQLPALWYTAQAMDSEDLRFRARERTLDVLEEIMQGDGHFHQHGADGIDLSYEGILHHFLSWAALLYDDPEIDLFVEKTARLKAYQTLPEPTGHFFSPSHFNTGTAKGQANDQWHSYQRDLAMAMLTEEAQYLAWTGRTLPDNYIVGLPSETDMRQYISESISRRNADEASSQWAWQQPADNTPGVWRAEHWLNGLPAATMKYKPDFYATLETAASGNSAYVNPPFLRDENFIEQFGDAFVVAKFDNYGVIIHTGSTVGEWANGVPGLSGGSLSAFWTKETGSVILGRSRGTQSADADQWTGAQGWDTWAVNTISGTNAGGQPFSAARHRVPTVTTTIDGTDTAVITVAGAIGQHDSGRSAPNDAITGVVTYERTFSLAADGLTIETSLNSDGTDQVNELWETLPIFLSDTGQDVDEAVISFLVDDAWLPASADIQPGVTEILITRFGESVKIVFDAVQRVKLSPEIWESTAVSSRGRNIMVDLLGDIAAPASLPELTSLTYVVRPADVYAHGDTSGDGLITAYDAAAILQHLIDFQVLDPAAMDAADVSGDGAITAFDASLILQYMVGLISCLPASAACN